MAALNTEPPATLESFLASIQMLYQHLRLKEADRWTPAVARIKHVFFVEAYPEVSDRQFLWCCERWIQSTKPEAFHRLPTWDELMRSLYRCKGGKPERSWGFRDDLPPYILPSPKQVAMLPSAVAGGAPDDENHEAYQVRSAPGPLLPPTNQTRQSPLERLWQQHLEGGTKEGNEVTQILGSHPVRVLEGGLLKGLWSIRQFNGKNDRPHFPRLSFLQDHPEFRDLDYRDVEAFKAREGTPVNVFR